MRQAKTSYSINVETSDGDRYIWDHSEYATPEEAAKSWSLDAVKRLEPRAAKIIVIETVVRDLYVAEQEIEGALA